MNKGYILLLAPRHAGEERQQSRCPPGARAKMQPLFIDRPLAQLQ